MKHTRRALSVPAFVIALTTLLTLLIGASLLNAQSGFGTGWTVQYFNNTNLSGTPILTETLPGGINFTWGTGSPNPAVPAENFSARYTSVQNLQAGTYEFVVSSDDGVRVFIDNVLVLDRFFGRVLTTDRFTLNLTAGSHTFVVEYVEFTDQAALSFQWFLTSVTTPGATVPPGGGTGTIATVGPGVPTAYTGPTATVTGVDGLALRTGPYVGASFITTLTGGSSYPVLARNADEGIYNWYLLQLVDGRTGWASGRYLQLSVDRNTLPLQGSIFDQIDDAADLGVVAIPRAVMNIRVRPSERTAIIGSIPWGGYASLIGRTVQAGQNRWLQVRYEGVVGWIAAPWVTIQGEIYAVPVR